MVENAQFTHCLYAPDLKIGGEASRYTFYSWNIFGIVLPLKFKKHLQRGDGAQFQHFRCNKKQ